MTPAAPVTAPQPGVPLNAQQMEAMFGGLDRMQAALPPEVSDRVNEALDGSPDPEGDKASFANIAFLADAYNKPPDEIAGALDAYREDYAKQAFKITEPIDDKAFYARVGKHYQQRRDERTLLGEGMGKMFEAFRGGNDNWKQTFTASLAEMKDKPGYEPARLDLYRHLAEQQWNQWQDAGQHYPAAVDAVGSYLKLWQTRTGTEEQQLQARQLAIKALQSVPDDQQDAILGLAMRGAQGNAAAGKEAGFSEKLAGRLEGGIGSMASSAATGFRDLFFSNPATGGGPGLVIADQVGRKSERRLDNALLGQDPYKAHNWLAEGVLGAAEGLPRMLAMFHPAGVAANVMAYSEEARGHFEDAGVAPDKAAGLGLAASIPLTALMAVTSKTVAGETGSAAMEAWMLRNVAGKAGSELVKGYAKNLLAQGAENTLILGGITAGQQLTEPAVQSIGHLLDGTIPDVQWTGKDGELNRLVNSTPETMAQLVPLIVLGTGMGTLRNAANLKATVQNEAALKALGFDAATVKSIMAASTPEEATATLRTEWGNRKSSSPKAVEELNSQMEAMANEGGPTDRVSLAPDGSYVVKDSAGNVIDQAATPEMAAKAAAGDQMPLDLQGAKGESVPVEAGQPLGIAAGGGKVGQMLNDQIASAKQVIREVSALPVFKGFKEVLNKWVGNTQLGIMHTAADIRQVVDAMPDSLTRKAIGRWLDAGGDMAQLEAWRKSSENKSAKDEYAAALKLTPEQIQVAEKLRDWFKQRFDRAVAAGVLDEKQFRENYLTQLIERPFVQGGDNSKFGAQLNKNFKFSKERVFPNLFELEKAGYNAKTTDVAEIMASYDGALNKAILSRQLVKDLLATKNEQGQPLAVPLKGNIKEGEGTGPNFISNPRQTVVDEAQQAIDKLQKKASKLVDDIAAADSFVAKSDLAAELRDVRAEIKDLRDEMNPEDALLYKSIDHPSLRKWWWIGKDATSGKETFMEGDIGLHPEIKTHLENALGTSGLRKWYDSEGNALQSIPKRVIKAIDVSNGFLKRNLLGGLSLFHSVHEYKRALGSRVAVKPWALPEIDPTNDRVKLQLRTGLMLATPHDVTNIYSHQTGLGEGGSLVDVLGHAMGEKAANAIKKLPEGELRDRAAKAAQAVGDISRTVSEYTFQKLIPALKSEVWNHIYERNLETFKDAIAKGDATPDQVAYLTSNQVNARFGHQNYADLGRNPTVQHWAQLMLLAPDFWESNLRNYGQVMQGFTGSKTGREPLIAFAATGAALWLASRVINKAVDDDWHFEEPFGVVHDGRKYTMRNEVEDLWRMWHNARQYVMGRLSPTLNAIEEWRSGRNWRGEKITTFEVFKNWISKVFPMSLRFLPGIKEATDKLESGGGRNIGTVEQLLGSVGVQVARSSPLNDAYQLANDWKAAQGEEPDTGTYPVSKYQQMRYALEDGDTEKAKEELTKLKDKGEPLGKIVTGFRSSILGPWTGSRVKDIQFRESLDADQTAKLEAADAHRQKVFQRFLAIIGESDPGDPEQK